MSNFCDYIKKYVYLFTFYNQVSVILDIFLIFAELLGYHMYTTKYLPNTRLQVADALRGIAIVGIILLHNIEHLNFFHFPEATNGVIIFLDKVTNSGLHFVLKDKTYSIFAMMFGLSFFIQNDNQMQRGKDFTLRFIWRMFLLLIFGLMNSFFFDGDILFTYAMFGMLLPFVSKLSTKTIAIIACFLLLQPVEIYKIINAWLNLNYPVPNFDSVKYLNIMMTSQEHGTIWESGWNNIRYSRLLCLAWDIDSGRITQLPGLFLLGMLLGRLRLFYNEKNNLKTWGGILVLAFVIFIPTYILSGQLPGLIFRNEILVPARILFRLWNSLAQTFIYVSVLALLFYSFQTINRWMLQFTFLGRASMTNYFLQSILGALIYYGWGFALYRYCGFFFSFLIGIGVVVVQYLFCRWWFKTHKHGPMEGIWKKLTWINFKFEYFTSMFLSKTHGHFQPPPSAR